MRAMLARTGDGDSGLNLQDRWLEQVTAMGPRIWESDDGLKEQGWLEGWHEMMCGVGGAQSCLGNENSTCQDKILYNIMYCT